MKRMMKKITNRANNRMLLEFTMRRLRVLNRAATLLHARLPCCLETQTVSFLLRVHFRKKLYYCVLPCASDWFRNNMENTLLWRNRGRQLTPTKFLLFEVIRSIDASQWLSIIDSGLFFTSKLETKRNWFHVSRWTIFNLKKKCRSFFQSEIGIDTFCCKLTTQFISKFLHFLMW